MRFQFIILALSASLLSASIPTQDPRLESGQLKDPSLVRCYLFQEGQRGQVKQLAGDSEGELFLANESLYGEPFSGSQRSKWLGPDKNAVGVKWGKGRFPGTFAIRPGSYAESVVHSRFYTTSTGSFSIEAWVRPRDGAGVLLWSGLSALEKGGFGLADDGKNLAWAVMTKKGPVKVETASLKRGLWHQVVCSWNAQTQTAELFVDGVQVGEAKGEAAFVPSTPPAPSGFESTEDDYDGMRVGGFQGAIGTLIFDVDQILVFSRVMSAQDVSKAFARGKVSGTAEEQLAAFQREKQEESAAETIDLSIPKDSFGYFPVGAPVPLTFRIPANDAFQGKLTAAWNVQDVNSKVVKEGAVELSPTAQQGAEQTVSLKLDECGLYFLRMEVRDDKGAAIRQVEYPIGIIVSLPPPDQRPISSPLGAHAAIDRWPEATVLGVSHFRPIGWWSQMEPKPGVYNFEYNDQMVEQALKRNMEIMFCLNGIPSFNDDPAAGETFPEGKRTVEQYRSFLTALVRHYKGKVKSWEIVNETNACAELGTGTERRAKNYVEMLKAAYEVIKQEDPEAKVIGICGCPGFVPWTEAVLAAGGGPYFDVLSVHNYRVSPITESARDRNIARVREVLKRYGKECAVWSTEFGVHQPRRIDGRPMAKETLFKLYSKKLGGEGDSQHVMVDMPLVPESQAADWTIQAWLLDLANGAERFYMLMGPNRFTPPINDSEGSPSEMGVAFAAMAKVIMNMERAEMIPLDSLRDAGISILQKDGKRDVVLFSEDRVKLAFKLPPKSVVRGMDRMGNPWEKQSGKDGILWLELSPQPLYLLDVPKAFSPVQLIRIEADDVFKDGKLSGNIAVNNPGAPAANYRLSVKAPKGIQAKLPASVKLAAHATAKVPFELQAKEISRGTHEVEFTVSDEAGKPIARTQHLVNSLDAVIPIPRMKAPIPFNADPKAWKDIPARTINEESFVLSGKPVPGVPWAPQWRNAEDLSFSYRLAWSPDEGIALLVEVTDDQFRAAPENKLDVMFRYDCLEVFIDTRPPAMRQSSYSTGAEQILIRPPDSEVATPAVFRAKSGDSTQYDIRFLGRRTAAGYILEGRIKPKAGATWKLEPGLPFALDMVLDDADKDLRKTVLGIGFGGVDNAVSTERWGWFKLSP